MPKKSISRAAQKAQVRMHEISLAENIVKILEKELLDPEITAVKIVYLEVGYLRYIVPEILETAFLSAPKDEKLKNAKLKIKVLPLIIKCLKCGKETIMDKIELSCAHCSSDDVKLIGGKEFSVKEIEW
ncbi:Hydrogenase expression/synthesis, HypA [Candidatus Omnitrophus magneticus]|uniref:Hydrogenase expression/synthesis, HypA n=1 Tax=Candidatus Omnitrophus magneticus TaxID=1609969 RepID=A0A0F0CP27_9BACT|nr:Hydrogenase expression/synthesis, HypA [Candidatus Omnitrophus magneticus]